MKIEFNNLYNFNKKLEKKFFINLKKLYRKSKFIGTNYEKKFEHKFSRLNKSKFCISCSNGSDALLLALKALDLKKDQEVIVPNHSYISTATTVSILGGKVKFCDTKNDFTIDENKLKKIISKNTVGVIAVHLYGFPCNISDIKRICNKKKIWLIEDCAQSHFSKFKDKFVGNFGDIGTFSFYPGKNLGTIGDAGAIVTNKKKIKDKLISLRFNGSSSNGNYNKFGLNARMNSIHALFLSLKLDLFKDYLKKKNNIAKIYLDELKQISQIQLPIIDKKKIHTWHLFVIKCKKREKLINFLNKNNISTSIHYKKMLIHTKLYSSLEKRKSLLNNSLSYENKILSLPIDPYLKKKEVFYIINKIKKFYVKKF